MHSVLEGLITSFSSPEYLAQSVQMSSTIRCVRRAGVYLFQDSLTHGTIIVDSKNKILCRSNEIEIGPRRMNDALLSNDLFMSTIDDGLTIIVYQNTDGNVLFCNPTTLNPAVTVGNVTKHAINTNTLASALNKSHQLSIRVSSSPGIRPVILDVRDIRTDLRVKEKEIRLLSDMLQLPTSKSTPVHSIKAIQDTLESMSPNVFGVCLNRIGTHKRVIVTNRLFSLLMCPNRPKHVVELILRGYSYELLRNYPNERRYIMSLSKTISDIEVYLERSRSDEKWDSGNKHLTQMRYDMLRYGMTARETLRGVRPGLLTKIVLKWRRRRNQQATNK